jgi:hypothetical protein
VSGNEYVGQIVRGVMDDGATRYVPGVHCMTCGRFVGRDGWIEIETFEMSEIVASVEGECARCLQAQTSKPFCSNPGCICAQSDPKPCEAFARADDATQARCARCGWVRAGHGGEAS